jgi:hypothetical protein
MEVERHVKILFVTIIASRKWDCHLPRDFRAFAAALEE